MASLAAAKTPADDAALPASVDLAAHTAATEGDGRDWKYTAMLPHELQFAADN